MHACVRSVLQSFIQQTLTGHLRSASTGSKKMNKEHISDLREFTVTGRKGAALNPLIRKAGETTVIIRAGYKRPRGLMSTCNRD